MKKSLTALILVSLAGLATSARADDDFHFRLGHNILLHTWTQSKVAGETYHESNTQTFKGGWELYTYGQNLNFYFYPGQEGSSAVIGYSIQSDLELGVGIGYQAFSRDKAVSDDLIKESHTTSTFSPYLTKYLTLGERETLELTLSPSWTQSTIKQTSPDGGETSLKDHAGSWTVTGLYDRKIGQAWHYYGSLALVQLKAKSQEPQIQALFVPFGVRYELR